MRNILIHCKPSLLDQIKEMGLYYTFNQTPGSFGYGEVDVIVPDIDTPDTIDGVYIDPDKYLCEFYELDYDQVNCVEVAWCLGIESLLNTWTVWSYYPPY